MAQVADNRPFTAERLIEPDVIRNPYRYYDLLRPHAPVFGYRDYPPGVIPGVDQPEPSWVVLSYEDVAYVAKNHELFSSRDSLQEQSAAPSLMLVNHDKPEHTRLRRIAAEVFYPSVVEALAPDIEAIADGCLRDFVESAEGEAVDVMDGLCAMLPSRVMAFLLGMPMSMDQDIRRWATAFMLSADLSAEERQACNVQAMEFITTHARQRVDLLARGETAPGPLLNSFIQKEVDGDKLSFDEVVRFCMTTLVAGAETTSFALGNLVAVFADYPVAWDEYRADESKFEAIFDETLRIYGPPQRLFRVATRDVELRHAKIKRGDWVACFFGAANYDPAVFPDPYTFSISRGNSRRHMSFGHGIHRCLGGLLAQLEARSMARSLRARYRRLARAAPAEWQAVSMLNHGLAHNFIRFER